MENYNLNYEYRREVDSDSSSEESSEENFQFNEQKQGIYLNRERDMVNIQNIKYQSSEHNIVIDTNDRDWSGLHKNTFLLEVKFNTSGTSKEEIDEFKDPITNKNDLINKFHRQIRFQTFEGSKTLSVPYNIKNVETIELRNILLPTRSIYIGNGNFIKLQDLHNIIVTFDEFNSKNYGTNNIINNCICTSSIFTPIYQESSVTTLPNFVEFKNSLGSVKKFKPAPLNSLNGLTIKFYDNSGNQLKYQNDILTLKSLDFTIINNNFIKITTNEYFTRKNYRENDIILFKDLNIEGGNDNNQELISFLNREQGHKIYFDSLYEEKKGLNVIQDLVNNFYIVRKGKFNNEIYIPDYTDFNIIEFTSGSILNKNMQIIINLRVTSKEKSISIFNPEII